MNEPEWRYHDRSNRCPVSPLHKVERERYLGGVVLCKAKDAYWPNTLRYRDWTAFEQRQASAEVPENPPAFPCETDGNPNGFQSGAMLWTYPGMTLRDWFAGQALAGVGKHMLSAHQQVAEHCYGLADAMLRARGVTLTGSR